MKQRLEELFSHTKSDDDDDDEDDDARHHSIRSNNAEMRFVPTDAIGTV